MTSWVAKWNFPISAENAGSTYGILARSACKAASWLIVGRGTRVASWSRPSRRARSSPMPLTIVVVDDSAEYRDIIRYLLASESDLTIVGEAEDGEEGLLVVRQGR